MGSIVWLSRLLKLFSQAESSSNPPQISTVSVIALGHAKEVLIEKKDKQKKSNKTVKAFLKIFITIMRY
jgi:hypothetical protein